MANTDLDSDIIVSAVQFWKKVYDEKEVKIKFVTKDNRDRIMHCTLDFSKIPEEDHPKSVNIEKILKLIQVNKIMHVYDLEKLGWRSVGLIILKIEKVEDSGSNQLNKE